MTQRKNLKDCFQEAFDDVFHSFHIRRVNVIPSNMRFVVTLLILITNLFLYAADKPAHYQLVKEWVSQETHRLAYSKEIQIEGFKFLTRSEIEPLLPAGRTIFWWWINLPLVEAGLRQNTLVADARAERCGVFSLKCFHVVITEREPAFFAVVGNKAWLAGSDGGIIKPIPADRLSEYVKGPGVDSTGSPLGALAEELRIPVVAGLLSTDGSSDMIKARFAALRRAMDIIEETVSARISFVEPVNQNEVRVRFFGHNFSVTFEIDPEDIWKDKPGLLSDHAARLRKVLSEFGPDIDRLVSVDLAFDKIAVIKTN